MAAGPLLISEPLQRYRGAWRGPLGAPRGMLAAIAQRLSRSSRLLAVPRHPTSGASMVRPFEGQARTAPSSTRASAKRF